MKKLMSCFKGNIYQCILAPLFKMTEAGLELIIPLIVARIIDNGISAGDKDYIVKNCIIIVVLGFVGYLLSLTAQYFAASASVNFTKKLKHNAFEKMQSLSFSQLDEIGTSTIISRLTGDMDAVQNGINLALRLLLRSPFVVFGACIMSFAVDAKSSIVFAVVIPILAFIIFGVMSATVTVNKKVRQSLDNLLLNVREYLLGIRVFRAYNTDASEENKIKNNNDFLTELQEKSGRISALLNPLTAVVINIGIAVLIYVGAIRVNEGRISTGNVVALYNYMMQILVELVKLANLIVTLSKSVACAQRISDFLNINSEIYIPNSNSENRDLLVEFKNVSFSYPGVNEKVLDNISFSVSEGEHIGIIGATGSGKTTLVSLIFGFYFPTEGSVCYHGENSVISDNSNKHKGISFAEQKPTLFEGTIRSNLKLANEDASDSEMIKALKIAQAYDFIAEKDGLNTTVEQDGRNFSGGQKQRLSVARALLKPCDLMILDDSSSSLDYITDFNMRKSIFENCDSAVIIVSQRTGSIMNCDKIILLEDGKATIGTHKELLSSSTTYKEIHLTQFEEVSAE